MFPFEGARGMIIWDTSTCMRLFQVVPDKLSTGRQHPQAPFHHVFHFLRFKLVVYVSRTLHANSLASHRRFHWHTIRLTVLTCINVLILALGSLTSNAESEQPLLTSSLWRIHRVEESITATNTVSLSRNEKPSRPTFSSTILCAVGVPSGAPSTTTCAVVVWWLNFYDKRSLRWLSSRTCRDVMTSGWLVLSMWYFAQPSKRVTNCRKLKHDITLRSLRYLEFSKIFCINCSTKLCEPCV